MSAFKRKRGGRAPANKKAKQAKIVAEKDETSTTAEEETKNEATVLGPVSKVNYEAIYYPLKWVSFLTLVVFSSAFVSFNFEYLHWNYNKPVVSVKIMLNLLSV